MPSSLFRSRPLRRIATPLVAVAIVTGVVAGTALPAAASGSYNGNAYISGSGKADDDFNDEGVLNKSTNSVSNATCLWQNILYADSELDFTGIDGSFGPGTYDATFGWQVTHGLDADGSAGKLTFTKLGSLISWLTHDDGTAAGTYYGHRYNVNLSRAANGRWSFQNRVDGKWYSASYNTRTCPVP